MGTPIQTPPNTPPKTSASTSRTQPQYNYDSPCAQPQNAATAMCETVRALAQAFPEINSGNMLANLSDALISKFRFSIAGSTATYIHAFQNQSKGEFPELPDDVDVVVSAEARDNIARMSAKTLEQFNLQKSESGIGTYIYTDSSTGQNVKIDLIHEDQGGFKPYFENAVFVGDYKVANTKDLLNGLRTRLKEPELSKEKLKRIEKQIVCLKKIHQDTGTQIGQKRPAENSSSEEIMGQKRRRANEESNNTKKKLF